MTNPEFTLGQHPYAVYCSHHGDINLTEVEYRRQMSRPDSRWACPICGDIAHWNDENYDLYLGMEES